MSHNLELHNAIKAIDFLSYQNDKQRADIVAALEALMVAGDDLASFRQAIVKHKTVWSYEISASDNNIDIKDDDSFLSNAISSSSSSSSTTPSVSSKDTTNELFAAAIEKRIEYGLYSLDDKALEAIITAPDNQGVRALLLQHDNLTHVTKAKGWNVNSDDLFICNNIRWQAQKIALLKKIRSVSNIDQLHALLKKDSFKDAAKEIKLNDNIINSIYFDTLKPLITDAVVLRIFAADAKAECIKLSGSADFSTPELLKKALELSHAPYNEITPVCHSKIKSLIIEQYLKLHLQKETDPERLEAIIKSDDKTFNDSLEPYGIDEKLGENITNCIELRNIATKQLLSLRLDACTNPDVLNAMRAVKTNQDVVNALQKYPELRFSGDKNTSLRQVFRDNKDSFKAIKAATHLRVVLMNADAGKLKPFIKSYDDANQLADDFLSAFPASGISKEELAVFFKQGNAQTLLREQALIAVLKEDLRTRGDIDELMFFDNNNNDEDDFTDYSELYIGYIKTLSNNNIDDLLRNNKFVNHLLAYGLAEKKVRFLPFSDIPNWVNNDLSEELANLPLSEQHHFKYRLATGFIKNGLESERLGELATAKTVDDFNQVLKNIGINSTDWLTKDYRDSLQKNACRKIIEDKINKQNILRPELLTFLSHLPLAKQQAIVANDALLLAIMNAKDSEALAAILDITADEISACEPLMNEHTKIRLCRSICNVNIADILVNIPGLSIDTGRLNKINKILQDKRDSKYVRSTEQYKGMIGEIADILKKGKDDTFFNKFGISKIEGHRSVIIGNDIKDQHNYNYALFKKETYDEHANQLLAFLATLKKEELLQEGSIPALINIFAASNTKQAFIDELEKKLFNQFLIEKIREKLTDELFQQLKIPLEQKKYLSVADSDSLLKAEQKKFKESSVLIKEVIDADKKIIAKLDKFASLSDMSWLSPEFQVVAKERAHNLLPDCQELADNTDILITQFTLQQQELERQLASLPTKQQLDSSNLSPKRLQALDDFRQALLKQQNIVTTDLNKYKKIRTCLKGNPVAKEGSFERKGVLQALTEAKESKAELIFKGISYTRQDYPLNEKQEHFDKKRDYKKAEYISLGGPTAGSNTGNSSFYSIDPEYTKLEPGHFREYTVTFDTNNKDEGLFIEERGINEGRVKTLQSGKIDMTPSLKLTANRFPEDPDNKCAYAMAMAVQMLSNLNKAPTADNPLILRNGTQEEISYLWTALMILGNENPNMAFDAKAIRVTNLDFDAKNQYKGFKSFFSSSPSNLQLYSSFKNNHSVIHTLKSIKALNKAKFDQPDQKRTESNLKAALRIMKKDLEATSKLEDIKKNNDENNVLPSVITPS